MRRNIMVLLLILGIVCLLYDRKIIVPFSRTDAANRVLPANVKDPASIAAFYYLKARVDYLDPAFVYLSDFYLFFLGSSVLIVVYWEVPIHLQRQMLLQRRHKAFNYMPKVQQLGWIGYLQYLKFLKAAEAVDPDLREPQEPRMSLKEWFLSLFQREKKVKPEHFCAACSFPTDQPDSYLPGMDFEKCPKCQAAIEPVFTLSNYIPAFFRRFPESQLKRRRKADDMKTAKYMSDLLSAMYALAVRYRATDIHIKRDISGAVVQARIDGMLSNIFTVPAAIAPALLSSIKVQARLDITNHTTPQDGRFEVRVGSFEIDIRINCAPTSAEGEILFIRLLDKNSLKISPEQLGFTNHKLEMLTDSIYMPHGLILVTGPTGSGKTTTLYMALNTLNNGTNNIITIEDPVEYMIPGLKQMQVHPEKNFTFATGLRSILRQDPDVIMLGEIRDPETANMAVEAASTGHLVFTTLHTMDSIQAVSRLNDLGIPSKRYSQALELIITQRLIRMLCNHCKVAMTSPPPSSILRRIGIANIGPKAVLHKAPGCLKCNQTGYFGRQAVLEMFKPDLEMRVMLEKETGANTLRETARRKGMRLLKEDAILKAFSGETTLEEVLRVVS